MRPISYIILIIAVSFFTLGGYGQQAASIKDGGETKLTPNDIELKNKLIEITPYITYSTNQPDLIKIKLKVRFEGKNGSPARDTNDWVYLISDWSSFHSYFKNQKDLAVNVKPGFGKTVESTKPITGMQNGTEVFVEEFKSGYSGFRDESQPINLYIKDIPSSEISITFNFLPVIRSRNMIKPVDDRLFDLTWEFSLPGTAGEQQEYAQTQPEEEVIDCEKLAEKHRKNVLAITDEYSIDYFQRQLKNPKTDLDRLSSDLQQFREDISRAGNMKKTLGIAKDLDECPEIKEDLIGILDNFIAQQGGITAIENELEEKKRNVCVNYEQKYQTRIKSLKLDKDAAYFESKINKSDADLWDIEDELSKYQDEIKRAKALKSDISKDVASGECSEQKNKMLGQIGNIGTLEAVVPKIQKQIDEARDKIDESKEQKLAKTYTRFSTKVYDKEDEFDAFEEGYSQHEDEILQRYNQNLEYISYLEFVRSAQTNDPDSIRRAQEILITCESEIKLNHQAIIPPINYIIEFESSVEAQLEDCKAAFKKIDATQGPDKARPIIDDYNALLREIADLTRRIKDLESKILENNEKIYDLSSIFEAAGKQNKKERIIGEYDSLFAINLDKLGVLRADYNDLQSSFNDKRYSKTYYGWVKRKFLNRAGRYAEDLAQLRIEQDTLIESKDIEFDKNGISWIPKGISEFNKLEADLKPSLEHLRENIEASKHRSFPWLGVTLGAVMLLILLFGARIYYMAYRKKKKEALKEKNAKESPSISKISITESPVTIMEKGKGLEKIRNKAGKDFLELDLNEEWEDTAVKKVYFQRDCIIKTYRFFEDSLKSTDTGETAYETGGYLVGHWDNNTDDPKKFDVSLEEFIEPGDDAKFSHYQLNFGAKIGVKLQKTLSNLKEKTGSEFIMTAWFHSHPGLKIFLSDFDLSVQEGFSNNRQSLKMIALVLDPYTPKWDTGIFTYKSDGSGMNNAADNKKFFSLDEMYNWAINNSTIVEKKEESKSIIIPENHYLIELTSSENYCQKVFFENQFILEMKRKIETEGSNFVNEMIGYLNGQKVNDLNGVTDLILKSLTSSQAEPDNSTLGTIIYTEDKNPDYKALLDKSLDVDSKFIICMIYNHSDQSVVLISKNKQMVYAEYSGHIKHKFTDMVDWTRKRN